MTYLLCFAAGLLLARPRIACLCRTVARLRTDNAAKTAALNQAGAREMILRSTIAQLRADEAGEMSDIVEDLLAVGTDDGPAPATVSAERMGRMFDDERTR